MKKLSDDTIQRVKLPLRLQRFREGPRLHDGIPFLENGKRPADFTLFHRCPGFF
jgi:hypothetical protein